MPRQSLAKWRNVDKMSSSTYMYCSGVQGVPHVQVLKSTLLKTHFLLFYNVILHFIWNILTLVWDSWLTKWCSLECLTCVLQWWRIMTSHMVQSRCGQMAPTRSSVLTDSPMPRLSSSVATWDTHTARVCAAMPSENRWCRCRFISNKLLFTCSRVHIYIQMIITRDANGYCFHLPVNRFHLPVNYRLTD